MTTQRAKVTRNAVARFRRWHLSDDRDVVEVRSTLGLPTRFLVVQHCHSGELVVSRHRVKSAAMKAASKGGTP